MDFMKEAIKVAGRSSIQKHKTGAVIFRDGEVISNGWSHVPHYKLRGKRSLHAEMHALARARHLKLRKADVIIATIASKSGNVVGAQPCLDCAIALRAAGIEIAYFTVDPFTAGWIELDHEATFADLKVYERNGN